MQALEKAYTARKQRVQRAKNKENTGKVYPEISAHEYQRRLLAEIDKDNLDAEKNIKERNERSNIIWRRKVGERFRDATTDKDYILNRVEKLRRNQTHGTSLVFAGQLGVGKTWTAYAYLNTLIKEGIMNPGNIVASTETATMVAIATSGYKRADMFVDLKNPTHKVFFIDDVGQAHFSNESARHEVWYELLDHVYANDLTLILTTNKSFQDSTGKLATSSLQRWLGDAAYDRMKYIMGPTGLIVPGNENWRPKVAKDRDSE